jgi:iron complex outermembrane receptor protein
MGVAAKMAPSALGLSRYPSRSTNMNSKSGDAGMAGSWRRQNAGQAGAFSQTAIGMAALLACVLASFDALAQRTAPAPPDEAQALPDTVVTAGRVVQNRPDVAASIDVVSGRQVREAGPLVNLSEALARVPGLGVLNRQNMAQDLQISSRGFGARSTFGVRGVRLVEDGIPLTMPDGQGQTSSFDLASVQRVEVLRGPASALYGNASGGVVQVFSESGPPVPEASIGVARGRDGLLKSTVKAAGQQGRVNYVLDASQTDSDGYRDHSEFTRYQAHARLQWALDDDASFTFVGSHMVMPNVQDPLGLDAAQLASNPEQAGTNALSYNTRKRIENSQAGGVYERKFGADALRLMVYGGTRQVTQYQSIPRAVQLAFTAPQTQNDTHPGGVIDLNRIFSGLDARYTLRSELLGKPLSVTGGLAEDQMSEHRLGFQSFIGSTLGVMGAKRRDEQNTAKNHDQYLMCQWDVDAAWQASLGMRHSRVGFKSEDHYVVLPNNGDDSGRMDFESLTPTASLLWRMQPSLHVYGTLGRSFETPTLNEVAYKDVTVGSAEWNRDLRASSARHVELGMKAQVTRYADAALALFRVDTNNEIGVASSFGGRTSYQNVGHTHRKGLEASTQWRLAPTWSAYASATWTEANYADGFVGSGNGVPAGNAIPGVPRRTAFAELVWRPAPQGWHAGLEWRHSGRIWANDVNTAYAPAYQLWALRTGWRHVDGPWRFDALARIDNLADKHVVGSVIVNESNGRYYEPAPGRAAMVSATLTRSF